MKLIRGRDLAAELRERASPSADQPRFLLILQQICQAVAYAHRQKNVLHRDLKPVNVMVGAFGEVQVMDWGLGKVLDDKASAAEPLPANKAGEIRGRANRVETVRSGNSGADTEDGWVGGTFPYMSPEQACGEVERLGKWSDVFSLGAILCQVLTGQPPYTGGSRAELWRQAREVATTEAFAKLEASGADGELITLAKSCLAGEPHGRPADAGIVADLMTTYLNGVQAKLRAAEVERARAQAKAAEERNKRHWQVGLAGAVLLLLTGGVMGWMWYRYDRERQEQQRVVQQLLSNQRVDEPLREADQFLDQGAAAKALEAARRALALSQDERISEEKRVVVKQRVSELERSIADDERDQRLQDRVIDLALPLESQGLFLGVEPPDLDTQIESAFRQFGLDFSTLSDQELLNHFKRRPEAVRNGLVAAVDLWAIKSRQFPDKAALSIRLLRLARAIDPDPIRDELRQIASELRVGTLSFQIWARMMAPIERILPQSRYQRLQDIAHSEPGRLPPLTVQLLADLLVTLKETDLALALVRQALHANPGAPGLHSTAALLLLIGKKPRPAEAIVHLQSLRAQRPSVGSFLAVLLAKEGRELEALTLCGDLCRMQPDALMPCYARSVALLGLKRSQEAEQVLREAVRQHADSVLLLSALGWALYERKKWAEAEEIGREAVRLQPDYSPALNNHGLTLYGLKRYSEAETALRKAISRYNLLNSSDSQDPICAVLHSNLGLILARRKKYEEAGVECRLAIRLNEGLHFAHNNLGAVFAAQEKWVEAEASLRKAIQLRADEPFAYANLGVALLKQNKVADANLACQEALRLDPSLAMAQTLRGMIAKREKQYPEAAEAYRTAIRLDPSFPDAHSELALVLLDLGKPDEAEASSREAVRLAPEDPNVRQELGLFLAKREKYAEAVVEYRRAIDLAPEDATGYSGLALVYKMQEKWEPAREEYRNAIRLQPKEGKYHRYLAHAFLEEAKYEEAIPELRAALAINPNDATSNGLLGRALLKTRRPKEAVEPLRRKTELKPDEAIAFVMLGRAMEGTGKVDDAILAFQQANKLDPKDVGALLGLAKALKKAGRFREEEEAYLRLIRLEPSDPDHQVDLGICRFNRNRFGSAIEAYREAIRLDPKHPYAYGLMGNALMAIGRFFEAEQACRKSLEMNSQSVPERKLLSHALRRRGEFQVAEEILDKMDRELPKTAEERGDLHDNLLDVRKIRAFDAALPDYLSGKKRPANTNEWLLLAELCLTRKRDAQAAHYYATAFETDPDRALALQRAHLLRAVACAVRAGAGAEGSADERTALLRQARQWLRTEYEELKKDVSAGGATSADRESVADLLRFWQETPHLALVRDAAVLAQLPAAERKEWQQFWLGVDALLKKLDAPAPELVPRK